MLFLDYGREKLLIHLIAYWCANVLVFDDYNDIMVLKYLTVWCGNVRLHTGVCTYVAV
jgi:hypothetical protein